MRDTILSISSQRCKLYSQIMLSIAVVVLSTSLCRATTKGLNQIVTPDIQPAGQLSLSLQLQDARIGNTTLLQEELGINKNFEAAVFEGFSPNDYLLNIEVGLITKRPWLLSTGFINWSPKYGGIQPFLEGGYYKGISEYILGTIDVANQILPLAGYAYQINDKYQVMADFEGGKGNFTSLGFTYTATPSFTINPALYFSNDHFNQVSPYIVFSYSFSAFAPHH